MTRQTNLSLSLSSYGVSSNWPKSWLQECRIRRCAPKHLSSSFAAIVGRESNSVTTHSALLQEWIQAKEISDAEEKYRAWRGLHQAAGWAEMWRQFATNMSQTKATKIDVTYSQSEN